MSWITYDHLSHTDSSFCKTLKVSSCCIKEKMILRFMRLCFVPLMSSIPWSPTAYIFCSHVYAYLPSAPQVLIYSLNFENDVSDFIFDHRLSHIFGPKDLKLWLPNLLAFIRLTMMLFCLTFEFSLGVNIFTCKGG